MHGTNAISNVICIKPFQRRRRRKTFSAQKKSRIMQKHMPKLNVSCGIATNENKLWFCFAWKMSILVVYTLLSRKVSWVSFVVHLKINSFQRTSTTGVRAQCCRLVLDTCVPASKKLTLILIKAIAVPSLYSRHLQWRRCCDRTHAEQLSSFNSRQIECRNKGTMANETKRMLRMKSLHHKLIWSI